MSIGEDNIPVDCRLEEVVILEWVVVDPDAVDGAVDLGQLLVVVAFDPGNDLTLASAADTSSTGCGAHGLCISQCDCLGMMMDSPSLAFNLS